MTIRKSMIQTLVIFSVLGIALASSAQSGLKTQAYSASDGTGGIRLLWFIAPEHWRGGWRVEDESGRVLLERVLPGEADAMRRLEASEQAEIIAMMRSANRNGDRAATPVGDVAFGLRVMTDWDFARAAGLAIELQGLERRRTAFVVRRLDERGIPDGAYLKTSVVDLAKKAPPPPPPAALKASASRNGISLYWRLARNPLPVLAYSVERIEGGSPFPLTARPMALGSSWPETSPAFVDANPPVESDVVYQVRALDALGRGSNPDIVRVFSPDFSALDAPEGLRAETDSPGEVVLSWKENSSPHTAGYLIERAYQLSGPFEILTPAGVSSGTARYQDKGLRTGTTYFYRVRSIGPRGDVGVPRPAVLAVVRGNPLPAPETLTAEAGHTRVLLTWQPVAAAAGYHVERRSGSDRPWSRLTGAPVSENRFDDHMGASPGGRFEYRVFAVGYDGQDGSAARPIEVMLPDTVPPAPPRVTAINGEGGRVSISFTPASPEEDTSQVLVLRSDQPGQQGLVIGDPLSGREGRFEDRWVEAGRRYYYRLVAVDPAGNRSDPGDAVTVLVGHVPVPKPAAPDAVFVREPFPHVRLRFTEPPSGLKAVVEAQSSGGSWFVVAGPVTSGEAVDLAPGSEPRSYRLRYQDAGGVAGPASDPIIPDKK